MALSLLRCQGCLRSSIWRPLVQQSWQCQQTALFVKRDFSICLNWNQIQRQKLFLFANSQSHVPNRQLVLFNRRGRLVRMSPLKWTFLFGFSCMVSLMIIDSLFDKYRRSGLSTGDLFSWFRSESKEKLPLSMENTEATFKTKYASLLSELETPELKPSRIVSLT